MKIGEPQEFFLIAKGRSAEEFLTAGADRTTADVLAATRHTSLAEVDNMKKQVAQQYIGRGEAVPVLTTVRIKITVELA
jgi:hypothetical protein